MMTGKPVRKDKLGSEYAVDYFRRDFPFMFTLASCHMQKDGDFRIIDLGNIKEPENLLVKEDLSHHEHLTPPMKYKNKVQWYKGQKKMPKIGRGKYKLSRNVYNTDECLEYLQSKLCGYF